MIAVIIYALGMTLVSLYLLNQVIQRNVIIKALKTDNTFEMNNVKKYYSVLAEFLRKRKSRFSVEAKVDLLSMWYDILLALPPKVKNSIRSAAKSFDLENTTLTAAEHKRAMIESLEVLCDQEKIDENRLVAVTYHLYYIIMM